MWRNLRNKSQSVKTKISSGRWRLVVAIIFLFAGSLLYKLFSLQIKECDIYTALAANQQQFSSKLAPERGHIYFTGDVNGQENLYPAATNKEFAILYAVPKDISNPHDLAEKFYKFFDESSLKNATAMTASGSPRVASGTATAIIDIAAKDRLIAGYEKHFNRPGVIYDSLDNKKLDNQEILKLYAWLASSTSTPVAANDLELKNNLVVYKKSTSSRSVELIIPGIGFHLEQRRYYPENSLGAHLLGFVSYANGDGQGRYGLEEFFNSELFGKYGSLQSDKAAGSNIIIADGRKYVEPINGDDLVLTIDRNVESFACTKLQEAIKKYQAIGGSVIAVNPQTGAIIAMCSFPSFDPNSYQEVGNISIYNNPALLYQYEPGSVFKTMTMSAALDSGKVTPTTTYKDSGDIMIPGWSKPIRNSDYFTHGGYGITDMTKVLEYSLNTGAIFAMKQTGPAVFTDYVKNYGFGEKTGVELGAESAGNIGSLLQKRVPEIDVATASFGQGIAATPLQMVMAYQAIANEGVLMKPYIVKAIIHNGRRDDTAPKEIRRVISAKTAATISGMLVNVVEFGHAKRAYINGYYVGGKTGTAQVADKGGYSTSQYFHTFVGIAPIDNPAFVMLTKLDSPKVAWAEGSALPLWAEIADFMLNYYQVPKTRSK
ncbi:MAG: penicillin-binding protein 2 [Patescibacteria group bacterium]|jgi:cell division protein FtsI (penicillin-binding protein 3)/stage V sporulation protein D (sporulation-specific penicillin-binding protein)